MSDVPRIKDQPRPTMRVLAAAAAAAPTIGLTLTWLWVAFLAFTGSSDDRAWKAALTILAVLTVCGGAISILGWIAALRLFLSPAVGRAMSRLNLLILPSSAALVLLVLVRAP